MVLLLPITLYAQNEHLTFKGIPITGTIESFSYKLVNKGFKKKPCGKGMALLQGEFAGYRNCEIVVYRMDKKNLVYATGVKFPNCEQWSLLESNYLNLKQMLITKYGEPSSCVERFQQDYVYDDSSKLNALKMDGCEYETIFETEKGRIVLALAHESVFKCFVVLGYIDAINGGLARKSAIDDL